MTEANTSGPRVSAIVLAYGAEPDLDECMAALRRNGPSDMQVVVVDNGCTRDDLDAIVTRHDALLFRPQMNEGFAGGCNFGARHAAGDVFVFVNSDAFVEPGCISALVQVAVRPSVGIASACIVLDEEPTVVNSVGNPIHVSGMSWAGGFGEPVEGHLVSGQIASATGCVMAATRERWDQLGGFWGDLFAYLEDTELSIRCWQRGLEVRYVAEARARHRYEFSRNELKLYLLERNRLAVLATTYAGSTLLRLAPVLVAFEALMCALALRQGWFRAKLRGYAWLWRNRTMLRERRSGIQAERRVSDTDVLGRFARRIEPANVDPPPGLGVFNTIVSAWCRLALGRPGPPRSAPSGQ